MKSWFRIATDLVVWLVVALVCASAAADPRQALSERLAGMDVFVADFAIDNQEAYEHYVSGLDHLLYFRYDEARGEFEAALALAPDFGIARYRLAYIQAADSEVDTAVANMELAQTADIGRAVAVLQCSEGGFCNLSEQGRRPDVEGADSGTGRVRRQIPPTSEGGGEGGGDGHPANPNGHAIQETSYGRVGTEESQVPVQSGVG